MSDIWQVLGLEGPTDDIRAIKKAYAKAVKLARPDEHPEQFQALNKAYKQAQRIARDRAKASIIETEQIAPEVQRSESAEQAENSDQESSIEFLLNSRNEQEVLETSTQLESVLEQPNTVETVVVEVPELRAEEQVATDSETVQVEIVEAPVLPEEPDYAAERHKKQLEKEQLETAMDDELSCLLEQVEQLLLKPDDFSNVEQWKFVERSQFLLDDQFNWDFGQEVFRLILAHNQAYAEAPASQLRDVRVFSYLDRFFDWRGNEHELLREHGDESCRPYLNALHLHASKTDPLEGVKGGVEQPKTAVDKFSHLENYILAGRLGRILANFIDWIVFIFAAVWINIFLPTTWFLDGKGIIYSIFIPLLMFLIMESSPLQASPGKLVLGYRVMRQDRSTVPWWLNIWRITCYILSTVAIKITFWINLFIGARILHDRLSGTMVVDIKKSYASYLKSFEIEL
ncbi:RDD family protein [Neptuniibacter sp. QD34_54]|uniref:RDD family protein n=1 Tax=Neptuniibacter sp. QD34_54 TaxID=3398208 RepID=UPI0039F5EA11